MNFEAKIKTVDGYSYLELDGLEVHLYRNKHDQQLEVAIYSDELESDYDKHECSEVPDITLIVNESREVLDANGQWIRTEK